MQDCAFPLLSHVSCIAPVRRLTDNGAHRFFSPLHVDTKARHRAATASKIASLCLSGLCHPPIFTVADADRHALIHARKRMK